MWIAADRREAEPVRICEWQCCCCCCCWRPCCSVLVSSDAQVLSAQRVLRGTAAAVRQGRQAGGRRSAESKRPAGARPHWQNAGECAGGQGQCVFVSLLETTTTAGTVQPGLCKGCAATNCRTQQVAAAGCVSVSCPGKHSPLVCHWFVHFKVCSKLDKFCQNSEGKEQNYQVKAKDELNSVLSDCKIFTCWMKRIYNNQNWSLVPGLFLWLLKKTSLSVSWMWK